MPRSPPLHTSRGSCHVHVHWDGKSSEEFQKQKLTEGAFLLDSLRFHFISDSMPTTFSVCFPKCFFFTPS